MRGKTIPASGDSIFSVTADADGPGLMTLSSGIGNEARMLTSSDQTPPVVAAAVQSVTNATGRTVNVSSSEGTGSVYIIEANMAHTTVSDFNLAITAKKGASGPVVTANTNVAVLTAGLTIGQYIAYAVDAAGNISLPSGDALATPTTGNIITITDGIAPTVTVALGQIATDQPGQLVNVKSSEAAGDVYIILEGINQANVADFNLAITAKKGATLAVTAANTDMTISTAGLLYAGRYYGYAVDASGNISAKSTNFVTINVLDLTKPVVTVAAQAVTNAAGQRITLKVRP